MKRPYMHWALMKTENAVGQKLWINDSTKLEIGGVLRDFNYESAGKPVSAS